MAATWPADWLKNGCRGCFVGACHPAATVTVGRIICVPLLAKKRIAPSPARWGFRWPPLQQATPLASRGGTPPSKSPKHWPCLCSTPSSSYHSLSQMNPSNSYHLPYLKLNQVPRLACLVQLFTHAIPWIFPNTNQANPCQPHSLWPHQTCHSLFFYPRPGIHSHCKLFQHSHCKLFHCSNIRIVSCSIVPTFALYLSCSSFASCSLFYSCHCFQLSAFDIKYIFFFFGGIIITCVLNIISNIISSNAKF